MSAWFRPTATVTAQQFMACIGASANPSHVRLGVDASGARAQKLDTIGGNIVATSAGSVAAGTYIHVALTLQAGGNMIAYYNGVAGTPVSAPGTLSLDRVMIGTRMSSGAFAFFADGRIAEVGMWNAVLAADEIASLAKGFACRLVRPSALRFYSRLIRNPMDLSGGIALTNTGGATVADHPRIIYPC